MAEDKPWVLISEVGDEGFHEDVVDILKQHFHLICVKEFLKNPVLHGPKIQAMLMWNYSPAAEPSLLSCLPSLKVVANGGVGIDHLDVPYINSLGVKVANTPGVVSDATADMAMALLLASARMVVEGETSWAKTVKSVEDEQAVGASYCEKLDDLLNESDFVVLAVNLTPESTGLISHRELSLMKPTATLINVSRGMETPFS
ncbi:hypothetical protein GOODEAATRI_008436 [Goodea atripinnis]|uniref:D-isomer specific 2-hydroxyacid dehydrogenase catalytic domain-containing protein n=1 Tax=Goodea atripinnis TaxID=208336 RepID=A0ABV0PLV7_9TELE